MAGISLVSKNDGSADIEVDGAVRLRLNANGVASVAAAPAHTDDSTKVPTTGWVRDHALGVDQAWRDVKAIRSLGITYTNIMAKPIEVAVSITPTVGSDFECFINGSVHSPITVTAGWVGSISVIVPAGASYRFQATPGPATLQYWKELS
jgi:hypothetical protein